MKFSFFLKISWLKKKTGQTHVSLVLWEYIDSPPLQGGQSAYRMPCVYFGTSITRTRYVWRTLNTRRQLVNVKVDILEEQAFLAVWMQVKWINWNVPYLLKARKRTIPTSVEWNRNNHVTVEFCQKVHSNSWLIHRVLLVTMGGGGMIRTGA